MSYFYTKKVKDIKVVEFDWKKLTAWEFAMEPAVKEDATQKFIKKYDVLVKAINDLLGKPSAIQQEKDSGRLDTKWHTKSGINAYLFRFTGYSEIRLYIYKK